MGFSMLRCPLSVSLPPTQALLTTTHSQSDMLICIFGENLAENAPLKFCRRYMSFTLSTLRALTSPVGFPAWCCGIWAEIRAMSAPEKATQFHGVIQHSLWPGFIALIEGRVIAFIVLFKK
jgi:hypothetical protein